MLFNPTSTSGLERKLSFIETIKNLVECQFSIEKKKYSKLIWSILDIGLIKILRADWENQLQNYQNFIAIIQTKRLHFKPLRNQTETGLQTFRKNLLQTEVSVLTKSKDRKDG